MFNSLANRPWSERLALLLLCTFPFISVSLPSGGSIVYLLLALPALRWGWGARDLPVAELRLWFLLLLLFFLLGALSLLYSADMENAVSRLERLLRLATLPLLVGLFVRLRLWDSSLLLAGLLLAAVSLFVQALYETLWLGHSYATGLYHKIIFGDMAMLVALLLFVAQVTLLRGRGRWLAAAALLLALYASVMSATRGAWLMVPVAALVMMWLYRGAVARRVWIGVGAAAVLVVVLLAALRPAPLVRPIIRGMHELQLFISDPSQATSWGDRLNMWRNAVLIWWDHPLLGTGIGDFNHDMRELVAQGRSLSSAVINFGHAHSVYFDTLATLGSVGLLLMVAALFIVPGRYFYRAWQQGGEGERRFAALAGLITVIAFAVFGFSEGWLSRNPFVNPYILYLALFAAALQGSAATRQGQG